MFKNGKLFGKINLIDFAVFLLLLILVVAAYVKFGVLDNTKVSANISGIEYSILIRGVRNYAANAFLAGDTLYDSLTGTNIGVIQDVLVTEHKDNVSLIDGTNAYSVTPEKYDIMLLVFTEGTVSDLGYFANKSIELKVGSEKKVETLYAVSSGVISSIKTK